LLVIVATDSAGNTASTNVIIDLVAQNINPYFNESYTVTVAEDIEVGTVILTIAAQDSEDELRYDWFSVEQSYGDFFVVDEFTGEISVNRQLDFESKSSFDFVLRATDTAGQYHVTKLEIFVSDVDEAPTDIELDPSSVEENSPLGTVVGQLSTVDPDDVAGDGQYTYSTTSSDFEIVGNEVVTKRADFDFESGNVEFNMDVTTTDSTGLSFTKTITINVLDVNEKPYNIALSQTTFSEDARVDTSIATVTRQDDDEGQTVLCSLASTADGTFEITNDNLVLKKPLDFETRPSLEITVVCVDDGTPTLASDPATFTIQVTDANDPPQDIHLSDASSVVAEDTEIGTIVNVVVATDFDKNAGDISFSLPEGYSTFVLGDMVSCTSNADTSRTCAVDLILNANLDYESSPEEVVEVTATDSNGSHATEDVVVSVGNVNEAPTGVEWVNGENTIEEESPVDTVVGHLRVIDQDAGQTFTFELTTEGSPFALASVSRRAVEGSTVAVVLRDPSALDYEDDSKNSFQISLRITDNGSPAQSAIVSTTIEVVDAPIRVTSSSATILVGESAPVGTTITSLTVSGADGASVTLTLADGSSSSFALSGTDVVVAQPLNYEVAQRATIRVVAQGHVFEFSVQITDEDDAPRFSQPSYSDIVVDDDARVGTTVVTVEAIDEDVGSEVSYSFASDVSPTIRDTFSIDETGRVRVVRSPSETQLAAGSHTFAVVASSGDLSSRADVTIDVRDDCFDNECTDSETCIDGYNVYECCAGRVCFTSSEENFASRSSASSSASTGLVAGIIVGVVAIIAIALVIMLIVRRNRQLPKSDIYSSGPATFSSNPTYSSVGASTFSPGVANPLYSWYNPDMSRQEASNFLMGATPGSFVVRDSKATPGWHILGVRTNCTVLHEKICLNDRGEYELMPSNGAKQPSFNAMPALVDHYTVAQNVPFVLSMGFSNPMYGTSDAATHQPHVGAPLEVDYSAPALPLKEKEFHAVSQLAASEDLYSNTAEARVALGSEV
jgi:hypothetical protein